VNEAADQRSFVESDHFYVHFHPEDQRWADDSWAYGIWNVFLVHVVITQWRRFDAPVAMCLHERFYLRALLLHLDREHVNRHMRPVNRLQYVHLCTLDVKREVIDMMHSELVKQII